MKRLTNLLAITLLTSCVTAFAQEQEETTTEKSAVEQSADIYAAGYNKFRFGGYGEILANFMDYGINRFRGTDNGSKKDHRNSISIPRFVLAFDYKFNSQWVLGAEIEFEAGGTGSAYEIENTENGEYEMEVEKGGEVALEQFHITRLIHPAFNVRAGHLIVPVGLTNEHHEPINFFGTSRPEGETTILPSTWHENGIEVFVRSRLHTFQLPGFGRCRIERQRFRPQYMGCRRQAGTIRNRQLHLTGLCGPPELFRSTGIENRRFLLLLPQYGSQFRQTGNIRQIWKHTFAHLYG